MAKWKNVLSLFLFVGIIIFSFNRSQKENMGGDFHVFWKSGVNLLNGQNLYNPATGEREFLYPPFAAAFFIPFSLLPFKGAAFVFYVLNFLLWAASFFLIHRIFIIYYDDQKLLKYGLIFSFLTSLKLFWNNIMMVQSNEVVFVICLMGIFSFLKKKENWAIFFFAAATGIKVWPVFFFFWLLIRGNRITFYKSFLSGFLVVFIPFIFGNGLKNLETFLQILSQISIQGKTEITYANQSLGATIFRLFTSYPPEMGKYFYTVWDLGLNWADFLFKFSFWGIFVLMILGLLKANKSGNKYFILGPSIIFLAAHLMSGKCFKAHLVTLSFVYMAIFMMVSTIPRGFLSKWGKALLTFAVILAFTGKELYGEKVQFLVGGYGAWTWLMVLSLIFFLFISKQDFRKSL